MERAEQRLRFEADHEHVTVTPRLLRREKLAFKVLAILVEAGQPVSMSYLVRHAEVSYASVIGALKVLVARGEAQRTGRSRGIRISAVEPEAVSA